MINEAVAVFGVSRCTEQEGNVTFHHYGIHLLDCCGYIDNCLQLQVESGINMLYS